MRIFSIVILSVLLFFPSIVLSQETEKSASTVEEIRNSNTLPSEGSKDVNIPVVNISPSDATQIPPEDANTQKGTKVENSQQKKSSDFEYKKYSSFGLNISSHSGIGLSYRYHSATPFLFQITGGVVSEGKSFFYAFGGEVQRELSKSKDKRAFGSFAIGIYGERYKEVDYEVSYYTGMEPPKKWKSDNSFSFAIGVGGELALGNSIVDSLSLGCEIYPVGVYITDDDDSDFLMFPGGAVYLFYNF